MIPLRSLFVIKLASQPATRPISKNQIISINIHSPSSCSGVLPLVFWCQDRIAAALKRLATARKSRQVQISERRLGVAAYLRAWLVPSLVGNAESDDLRSSLRARLFLPSYSNN